MTTALVSALVFAWLALIFFFIYSQFRPRLVEATDLRQMSFSGMVGLALLTYLVLTKFLPHPLTPLELLSGRYTLIAGFVVACILYRIRGTLPLAYAMLEIYVGLFVMGVSVLVPSEDITSKLVGIVGAIYIIVRGLDNAERGLSDRVRRYWQIAFPKVT